jgi:tetratricopeptide (TPR) repeat protein
MRREGRLSLLAGIALLMMLGCGGGDPSGQSQSETRAVELARAEAKAPLTKLIELYPNQHEPESAYSLLARVHRELGETDAELAVLTRMADLAADAVDTFSRLAEIAAARKDWHKVLEYSRRFQAVDPLQPEPHRQEPRGCLQRVRR